MKNKSTLEKETRMWAAHISVLVRRRGSRLFVSEQHEPKRRIGIFRTWQQVEDGLLKYSDDRIRELKKQERPRLARRKH
jgi:hypothetical protein